jgi:hypothetical protein
MESLLRWSIANSTPNATPPAPNGNIDPGIIDAILGKPESELMKEALAIAVDEEKEEDARLTALDDFEMVSAVIVCAFDLRAYVGLFVR